MAAAYAWADFVVTCAGAVTLAELAVAGLPALVVPLARRRLRPPDGECSRVRRRDGGALDVGRRTGIREPLAERRERARLRRRLARGVREHPPGGARDAADAVVRACLALVRAGAGAGTRAL